MAYLSIAMQQAVCMQACEPSIRRACGSAPLAPVRHTVLNFQERRWQDHHDTARCIHCSKWAQKVSIHEQRCPCRPAQDKAANGTRQQPACAVSQAAVAMATGSYHSRLTLILAV